MLKDKLAAIKSRMSSKAKSSNQSDADSFNTANLDGSQEYKMALNQEISPPPNRQEKPKVAIKKKLPVLENIPSPEKKVNALQLTLGSFQIPEENLMRKTLGEEQPNSTKSIVKKTFDFESEPFKTGRKDELNSNVEIYEEKPPVIQKMKSSFGVLSVNSSMNSGQESNESFHTSKAKGDI
jgi:hypothetical protein